MICVRRAAKLGYAVLAATRPSTYLVVYTTSLGHLPTPFDYLSLLNTSLPLVFVAIGQSLVVLTGGIDLSVGGMVGLGVAVTAAGSTGSAAVTDGWMLAASAPARPCGAVNGLIVARAASRRSSPPSPPCPSTVDWR